MLKRQELDEESVERLLIAVLHTVDPDWDDLDLTSLEVAAASDRDALVPPLHAFVFCRRLEHQAGGLYRAEVAVTLVTETDDQENAMRRDWRTKVGQRLHLAEPWRRLHDDETGVRSHGWKVTGPNEISEPGSTTTGDVWVLMGGFSRGS